eukprot:4804172-Amphidinium_carterae.1
MLKDFKDEEDAALRSTEAVNEANAASVLTPQDQEPPLDDPLETGTVAEGLSPRDLDDVRDDDDPALEIHAAQIAANQASDGSAASASEAIATALQRRAHKKITQKPSTVPMSSMPTVSEEDS